MSLILQYRCICALRPSWPFTAAITHIWLLSRVLADMSNKGAGLGEGFATDKTDAGLLSCNTWITVSLGWDVDNIHLQFHIEKWELCMLHSHSIVCLNVMGVPVWMRSCRCRAPGSLKALWQCTQTYGFSPLWTRRCLFRFPKKQTPSRKGKTKWLKAKKQLHKSTSFR